MPEKHNAERRERYTKAVEQLGNKEAPVRIGGVYTLVGLVDEWLLDENLDYTEKVREGQVIVNSLCAYIRSSFALAFHYNELTQDSPTAEGLYKNREQEFYTDKAALESEADIRLSIIKEIHNRLQSPKINTPGAWSDFEYDFSGSTFFYPIDFARSYYTKPVNFSGSTYQDEVRFGGSTYQGGADFSGSIYRRGANFLSSTYQSQANFSGSTYQDKAVFSSSTYQDGANFSGSTYQGEVFFRGSVYRGWVVFNGSTYRDEADFCGSTYRRGADFSDSTYWGKIVFGGSVYQGWAVFRDSVYRGEAAFNDSVYWGGADFSGSIYRGRTGFGNSIYQEGADLSRSTYWGEADFSGSIFCSEIYFGYGTYSDSFSRFIGCAPQFYDETNHKNTLFGSHNNDFSVENGRGYPIYRGLEGLPLGCDFLTAEQKEYLADKFREVDETKNKFREVKDTEGNAILVNTPLSLNGEIRVWREKVTTVKAEDKAPEEKNN
ncbi:hypothetical protein [Rothia aeria]|uniref:hypothetical protein n=1 Tax=Rothia aeria TaxID=172042 RepID=UPI0028ED6DB9|nr:hypothetical protein [Rothia aeria]